MSFFKRPKFSLTTVMAMLVAFLRPIKILNGVVDAHKDLVKEEVKENLKDHISKKKVAAREESLSGPTKTFFYAETAFAKQALQRIGDEFNLDYAFLQPDTFPSHFSVKDKQAQISQKLQSMANKSQCERAIAILGGETDQSVVCVHDERYMHGLMHKWIDGSACNDEKFIRSVFLLADREAATPTELSGEDFGCTLLSRITFFCDLAVFAAEIYKSRKFAIDVFREVGFTSDLFDKNIELVKEQNLFVFRWWIRQLFDYLESYIERGRGVVCGAVYPGDNRETAQINEVAIAEMHFAIYQSRALLGLRSSEFKQRNGSGLIFLPDGSLALKLSSPYLTDGCEVKVDNSPRITIGRWAQ